MTSQFLGSELTSSENQQADALFQIIPCGLKPRSLMAQARTKGRRLFCNQRPAREECLGLRAMRTGYFHAPRT